MSLLFPKLDISSAFGNMKQNYEDIIVYFHSLCVFFVSVFVNVY